MIENFTLVYNLGSFKRENGTIVYCQCKLDKFINGLSTIFSNSPFKFKVYIEEPNISVSVMQYNGKSMCPFKVFNLCAKLSLLADSCGLHDFTKIDTSIDLPF